MTNGCNGRATSGAPEVGVHHHKHEYECQGVTNGHVRHSSPPPAPVTPNGQSCVGRRHVHVNEEVPFHIILICYLSYVVLILFGYMRDLMRKTGLERNTNAVERDREGYVQLYQSFESFYTRNIYRRIRDAWNMPIASVPGARITIIDRLTPDYNNTFR